MGHRDGPMGHSVGGDKQPQNNHMRWLTLDGDWIFAGKQYFFFIFIHYWRQKNANSTKNQNTPLFRSIFVANNIHTYS